MLQLKDTPNYINQQDLLAWVTLGNIYISHSEDTPIVQTQGNQLTFHILPYN